MANYSFPLLFFFFICFFAKLSHAQSPAESFVLPVTKDLSTKQYSTTISYGTPLVPTKLVLDLGGPFLWLDCASRNIPSSSALTTPHRSIQCLTAKTHQAGTANSFLSSPAEQDQYQPCQVFPENTITGTIATEGELVEDIMTLQSSSYEEISETIHHLVRFTCSPTHLLDGLASGAKGMVGLGRSRTSLTSQVFDSFSTHRKLTLCLSSSNGVVLIGTMAFESPPVAETLRSLTFTPLLTNQNQNQNQINPSNEYFINVSSIKINGKRLSLELDASFESQEQEGNGGFQTQLSSIVPYTTMQSSIYSVFKRAFEDAAASMNMTRVAPVAPFEVCYSSRGIGGSRLGPNVPVIDFVMQSEMVKWSIYGRNSMVRVSKEVMCLGFMDGGLNPRNPIVIGGYQMEDVIVQFDLSTSMVGFSSSLLTKNTQCSAFKFGSMAAQSA